MKDSDRINKALKHLNKIKKPSERMKDAILKLIFEANELIFEEEAK